MCLQPEPLLYIMMKYRKNIMKGLTFSICNLEEVSVWSIRMIYFIRAINLCGWFVYTIILYLLTKTLAYYLHQVIIVGQVIYDPRISGKSCRYD